MSAGLREELRREAAKAHSYQVYARSLATARRARRRLAVAWALVIGAAALAVPLVPRAQPPPADGGQISIPRLLGRPALGSLRADRSPIGAASVVYTGYGPRFGPWTDDPDSFGLVGATTDRYRTLRVGYVDDGVALSPDGRTLATPGRLVDLATGKDRPLPGDGAPIAWSPDGRRLLINGERLTLADAVTGTRVDLGPTDAWTSAAWSADGRLAYESDHHIVIADNTGRTLGTFVPPPGSVLAGKGSWTPDGRAVALVPEEPAEWSPHWYDVTTGHEITGPNLPPVAGEVRFPALLGWLPDGSALFFEARLSRVLALTPGASAPSDAMTVPAGLISLDIAGNAIAAGAFRPGDPPFMAGPGLWPWPTVLVLMVVATVLVKRRKRRYRAVAIPWETDHGPL